MKKWNFSVLVVFLVYCVVNVSACPDGCECGIKKDMSWSFENKYTVECNESIFSSANSTKFSEIPIETQALLISNQSDLPHFSVEWISHLENLVVLKLSNNSLRTFSSAPGLPGLKKLVLSNNLLLRNYQNVPERNVSYFENLQELMLNNAFEEVIGSKFYINHLHEIFIDTNMRQLYRLYMEDNLIWGIKDDLFCETNLIQLYFNNNLMSDFFDITCLPRVQVAILTNNRIRTVTPLNALRLKSFGRNWRFSMFDIRHNPFHCDCRLDSFKNGLQAVEENFDPDEDLTGTNKRVLLIFKEELICYTANPEVNAGRKIMSLETMECEAEQTIYVDQTVTYVLIAILVFLSLNILLVGIGIPRRCLKAVTAKVFMPSKESRKTSMVVTNNKKPGLNSSVFNIFLIFCIMSVTACPNGCKCGIKFDQFREEEKLVVECYESVFSSTNSSTFLEIPSETQELLISNQNLPYFSVEWISHLENLSALTLTNNTIQTFSSAPGIPSLNILNLGHNNLRRNFNYQDRTTSYFPNLEILLLSNAYEDVPGSKFYINDLNEIFISTNMEKLYKVDLSDNLIWGIKDDLFCQTNIADFSFSNNLLTDVFDIQCLKFGRKLNLANNRIRTITSQTNFRLTYFEIIHLFTELDISNNPFHCDCHLEDFRDLLKGAYTESYHSVPGLIFDKDALRCYTGNPEMNAGRKLLSVETMLCDSEVEQPICVDRLTIYILQTIIIILNLAILLFGIGIPSRFLKATMANVFKPSREYKKISLNLQSSKKPGLHNSVLTVLLVCCVMNVSACPVGCECGIKTDINWSFENMFVVDCNESIFSSTNSSKFLEIPIETQALLINNQIDLPKFSVEWISHLKNLNVLKLSNNSLQRFLSAPGIPSLRALNLNQNKLIRNTHYLDSNTTYFENLEQLYLSNAYEEVPGSKFYIHHLHEIFIDANMKQLYRLNMSDNSIWGFRDDLFCETGLVQFYFNNNLMTDFFNTACLKIGRVLNLSNNRIRTISPRALKWLKAFSNKYPTSLTLIILQGNPLHCDCNLQDFKAWFQVVSEESDAHPVVYFNSDDKDELRCFTANPDVNTGRKLSSVEVMECEAEQQILFDQTATYILLAILISLNLVILLVGIGLPRRFLKAVLAKIFKPTIEHKKEEKHLKF